MKIAIDGPSGSGKSTLAKGIASHYGLVYIDTGALYRTVGLCMQQKGIDKSDAEAITASLPSVDITMKLIDGGGKVYLSGKPVGDEIRTPISSAYASEVSKIPEVRAFLLGLQKDIASSVSCVMDGRDIGTVIMPDADVKIFLTASNDDRAVRRYEELVQKGREVTLDEVKKDMTWRDANDRERAVAPAIPADDAVFLDNSGLSPAQTLEKAITIIDRAVKP